jgi:peroxiredoxin
MGFPLLKLGNPIFYFIHNNFSVAVFYSFFSGINKFSLHFSNNRINLQNLKIKVMSLQIGQQAPEFSLHDTDKNVVNLADFKGKNVLVLFFPLAFTGVCTKELCGVRDSIATYNNANAQVLGISVDSMFVLAKFKEEQNLNFPLLSDFNKTASTAYGAIYESFIGWMQGVSKRSAFIVDKDGNIQYTEVLESAGDLPNFEAINSKLAELA